MLFFTPYIITLENNQERKKNMENFYKKYKDNIIFFYGSKKNTLLEYKKKITTSFCNKFCTIPMVGCASSHILLWKHISKQNNGYYLIMEDDTYINLDFLNDNFNIICEYFLKNDNNIFLQLTGEGIFLTSKENIKNFIFETYIYHFFLGAYIITPNIAKQLYEYFYLHKINYHIDFSLNQIYQTINIKPVMLKNYFIGQQKGFTDSNMNNLNKTSVKCFEPKLFPDLYFILNLPICSISNFVITFMVILFFLLMIICIIYKQYFIFCLFGLLYFEIIHWDN